jgi:hypothetical protein
MKNTKRFHGFDTARLCCLAFLFLIVVGRAEALSYTYEYTGSLPILGRHWEEFVYRYTPGAGWSRQNVAGNKNTNPGALLVRADDGSTGQVVALDLLFDVYFSSQYQLGGWGFNISGETDALANFAGFGGATVDTHLDIDGEGFTEPWVKMDLSRDFMDNGSRPLDVVMPYVVGEVGFQSAPGFVISLDHADFNPFDLKVFDPTKSAVFGVGTEVVVTLRSAQVVPDSGFTLLLVGAPVGVILLLIRKRTRRWV